MPDPVVFATNDLAELVPGCFIALDASDGKLLSVSHSIEALSGWPLSHFRSMRDLLRCCKNRRIAIGAFQAAKLRPEYTQQVLIEIRTARAEPRWIEARLRLSSERTRLELHLRDVTTPAPTGHQRQGDAERSGARVQRAVRVRRRVANH